MKIFYGIILVVIILILGFVFIFKNDEKKEVKIENYSQEEAIEEEIKEPAPNVLQDDVEEKEVVTTIEASIVASKKEPIEITSNLVNFGFKKAENRDIDTIIIHSSYDALGDEPYDVTGLIKEYQQYKVSPHYLIDRKGKIYLLVEEKNIAYHAGVSQVPDGRGDVNKFSIGIELMNTKDDEYTNEQYDSLNKLLEDIGNRYEIKYTLGHDQIAPERKTDPWNFNWDKIEE